MKCCFGRKSLPSDDDTGNGDVTAADESTANKHKPKHYNRFLLLAFAILQNGLFGGIIFGWASIDSTMLIAPVSDGGAGVAHERTVEVFSWATSTGMVSSFLLGIILDKFGPRVATIMSCGIVAIGSHILSISNGDFTWFALGTCVASFGGPGIMSSIIHVGNLFPSTKNLVISTLNGSIAISFSVFAVFAHLWEQYESCDFETLFRYYSYLAFVFAFASFFLCPDQPFEEDEQDVSDIDMDDDDDDDDSWSWADNSSETSSLLQSSTRSNGSNSSINSNKLKLSGSNRLSSRSYSSIPDLDVIHEGNNENNSNTNRHGHRFDPPEEHVPPPRHKPQLQYLAPPSLHIQQPLSSGLRMENKLTESFMLSKDAIADADTVDSERAALAQAVISLKDQSFWNQLTSTTYLRACLFFFLSTFITNFYVSTLSTELADLPDGFSSDVRNQLTQTFTFYMSVGVLISVLTGHLIDKIGLEFCKAVMFVVGQLQMLILLFFYDNAKMMNLSFFFYTTYRSILYPVYISTLTINLGFKYFGVLLGIGFGFSGVLQLLMGPLANWVHGDCHLLLVEEEQETAIVNLDKDSNGDINAIPNESEDCFEGQWIALHMFELSIFIALMIIPYLDYRSRLAREAMIRKYKRGKMMAALSDTNKIGGPGFGEAVFF